MDGTPYWPFAVYVGAVLTVIAGKLLLSHFLGERHRERVTGEPYESGVPLTGAGVQRSSIKFFLIAILFVVFDLELVFIFAWAVAIHDLGWAGFAGVLVFVAILAVGLLYEWRMGSLDWVARLTPAELRARFREGAAEPAGPSPSNSARTPVSIDS